MSRNRQLFFHELFLNGHFSFEKVSPVTKSTSIFGKARWGLNQCKVKYIMNSFYGIMQIRCRVVMQSLTQQND